MDIHLKSQWTKKCVGRSDFLSSRVAILTGGQDRSGRSLVTVDGHEQMVRPQTITDLVDLVEYLVQTLPRETWNRGLAVLMDARNCDKDCVQSIVSVIDQLQMSSVCRVAVFYAIQPKTSKIQSLLKKMVGLRKSKTQPKLSNFQTVVVKDVIELQRYIDVDQLTADFGGFLKFNHSEWVKFIQTMDEFDERMRSVLNQVPKARDEMNILLEYELVSPSAEKQLLLQIRSRYNEIMQRLNVEHAIDECKAMAEMLRDAPQHNGLCEIRTSPSVTGAKDRLRQYEIRLIENRTELRSTWQSSELRIIALAKLRKYQAKAEKILLWIEEVGSALLASVPSEGGETNEDDKCKFTENILPAAKNVISLSENIRRKMRQIVGEQKTFSLEVADFDQCFSSAVDKFRKEAKRKELMITGRSQVSSSSSAPLSTIAPIPPHPDGVPQNAERGLFESLHQLDEWFRASLEFLGRNHPPYQIRSVNGYQELFYQSSSSWNSALKGFLDDHSLPPTDHLQRLKNIVPVIDSLPARNNARALINRVELLIKLFTGEKLLALEDMDEVCSWQVESPNSRIQNLVVSSDDKINPSKQDCVQLTSTRQRMRTSLNIERSRVAQINAPTTNDNSEKYLQEHADLFVGVSERRRRSRIDTKEQVSRRNGKTEPATLADLNTNKIPVVNNERRENPINGSEATTVERYISLDSRSLDAASSASRQEVIEFEERNGPLLKTALLPSIVKSTSGDATFENDSTTNRTISAPTRKKPTAVNVPSITVKGKPIDKTKQDTRPTMATTDKIITLATVYGSSNFVTKGISSAMTASDRSPNITTNDKSRLTLREKSVATATENRIVETTPDNVTKRVVRAEGRLGNASRNESNELAAEERSFLPETLGNKIGPADFRSITQYRPSQIGLVDNFNSRSTSQTADKSTEITAEEKSVAVAKSESILRMKTTDNSADKIQNNIDLLETAGNSVDLTLQAPTLTTTAEKSAGLAIADDTTEEAIPFRRKPTSAERRGSNPSCLTMRDCLRLIADSSLRPDDKLRLLSRLSEDLDEDVIRSGTTGGDEEELSAWRNCLSLYSESSLEVIPPTNRSRTLPRNGHSRLHFPFCLPFENHMLDSSLSNTHLRPLSNLSSNDTTDLESIPSSAFSLAFDEIMRVNPAQCTGSPTLDYDQEIEDVEEEEEEEEKDDEEDDYGCEINDENHPSVSMGTDYNSHLDVSSPVSDSASFDSIDEHIQRLRIAVTNRKLDAFELEKDRIRLQKLLDRNVL